MVKDVQDLNPTDSTRRVLIVDDDRELASQLKTAFRAQGIEAAIVHNADAAAEQLPEFRPQVGVIDIPQDHSIGFELLDRLRGLKHDLQFVLITAHADIENAVKALREGAFHYLTKPLDEQQLVAIVERAFEVAEAELELSHARKVLEQRERLYKRAIAYAHAVAYQRDYSTKSFSFIDEGIYQLTGYRPEEITPEVWGGLIEERVMEGEGLGLPVDEAIRRTWAGELKIWNADYRIRTRDGQERWLADSSVQIEDEQGKRIGSLGILQDITYRKRVEEELRRLNVELEDRVARRTEELRRSNIEIQETNRVLRDTVRQLREHERVMADELSLAQEVQLHFLPEQFPFRDQLRFAAYYQSSSKIGGDLYDVFPLGDRVAGFYVADASGHGVSAALVTAVLKISVERLRRTLRFTCPDNPDSAPADAEIEALGTFLHDLSKTLLDTIPERSFVTFFFGALCLDTGQLFLANAGHNPPIRYDSSAHSAEELHVPNNLPLGLHPGWVFEIGVTQLHPGDSLILYTDGITEALDLHDNEFGLPRLLKNIQTFGHLSPQELIDALTHDVAEFLGDLEPNDDQSLLVLSYQPSNAEKPLSAGASAAKTNNPPVPPGR
jgi:PAS domain S-box-containing protein